MDRIKYLISVLFIAFGLTGFSQEKITWDVLSNVKFESKYYKNIDEYLWYPTFGEEVLALKGKTIQIKGYLIPVDMEEGIYVLSANPYSACYFCGNAGPESVMSLKFKTIPKKHYDLDEVATFEGELALNDSDVNEMNYILLNCREVK